MTALSNTRKRDRLWDARSRLVVDGYAHGDAYWFRVDPDVPMVPRDPARRWAHGALSIAAAIGVAMAIGHVLR